MKAKQSILYFLLFIVLLVFSTTESIAQNGRLIGLVDNNLVDIDPQTGSLTQIISANIPPGITVTNLAYAQLDCLFYGIVNSSSTTPTLISIGWSGNYYELGPIDLPGQTVFSCKALAFNNTDNKLYAAVNLNGGVASNDFFSESIVELVSTSGVATFVTQLNPGSTLETDIDDMVFINNILYLHDGDPNGSNTSRYYKLNFQNLSNTSSPTPILQTNYLPERDLSAIGSQLYISTSDLGLHQINTDNNTISYIGQTHATPEFNGKPIEGLDYAVIDQLYEFMIDDTLICDGSDITLGVNIPAAILTWNTGEVGNFITVNQAGMYWAEILYFNCLYYTDTINVETEDCGPCVILYNQINDDLALPADTTICNFHELELSINLDLSTDIVWNTGQTGNSIIVNQPGTYEATVYYEDCIWPSTSFILDTELCDTCIFVELAVEDQLFIGNDTTICLDESVLLNIDLDDSYAINWSNGTTGSTTTITEAGTYLATISTEDCVFDSDSIRLSNSACGRPCEYFIPNAFSPQGDNNNDLFQVYFGTKTCTLVSIEILIFDRWGGFLFRTDKNEWDGFIGNEAIGVGTYVYLVKMVIEQDGELKDIIDSGDVTVLR